MGHRLAAMPHRIVRYQKVGVKLCNVLNFTASQNFATSYDLHKTNSHAMVSHTWKFFSSRVDSLWVRCLLSTTLDICTTCFSELGLGGGMAITVKLKPTAIDQSRKKLPIQFVELNNTSICNLLDLVWP